MRLALFVHSLLSDWNHGNAHFLRGLVTELATRGHEVRVFEPADAWSVENLVSDAGEAALHRTREVYPAIDPVRYVPTAIDDAWLDRALDGVDLVVAHEWNAPSLIAHLGRHRRARRYRLVFHDTHHRSVSAPETMAAYDLSGYDGVLAFGRVIRDLYLARGWTRRAWVFHEAADVRVFAPPAAPVDKEGDLVWIGNWGDDERTRELHALLLEPVRTLGLRATVHGVRYPADAQQALRDAGIRYAGWLANYDAPAAFARHRVTVHVPRRQYVTQLPGIPTIRPFEAMAAGIPLVSAPWDDIEHLFTAGKDYLVAPTGATMREHLRALLDDPGYAAAQVTHARRTILQRHTCAHRADELLAIAGELGLDVAPPSTRHPSTSAVGAGA